MTSSEPRAFVDYYSKLGVSPVSQDVSDRGRHFQRRQALYRQLGLVPGWLRGKRIIEFGPGSGHNALYTVSLEPREYVLVEGNPTGVAETRSLLASASSSGTSIEVLESYIEDFDDPRRFDLVLCEGVIPGQREPARVLRSVARNVADGGALVITTADNLSMLSEVLRRLLGHIAAPQPADLAEQLRLLRPLFEPHLTTLPGRSRPVDDWIIDSITQPFVGRYFGVPEALCAIGQLFDIQATSPRFIRDWRWYKDVWGTTTPTNNLALRQYWESAHNLLDWRFVHAPRPEEENARLMAEADRVLEGTTLYGREPSEAILQDLAACCSRIAGLVQPFAPETAASLRCFNAVLAERAATGRLPTDHGAFCGFFGRGQQYVSFVRTGPGEVHAA